MKLTNAGNFLLVGKDAFPISPQGVIILHVPVPPAPPTSPYLVFLELIQNGSKACLLSQHGGVPPDDASNQEGLYQREESTWQLYFSHILNQSSFRAPKKQPGKLCSGSSCAWWGLRGNYIILMNNSLAGWGKGVYHGRLWTTAPKSSWEKSSCRP